MHSLAEMAVCYSAICVMWSSDRHKYVIFMYTIHSSDNGAQKNAAEIARRINLSMICCNLCDVVHVTRLML